MRALAGLAAQGDGAARRLADGRRLLAREATVRRLSRPWWTPAALGERAGLLAAALVEAPVRRQETRAWLDEVASEVPGLQAELVAGLDQGRWRWAVDVAGRDAAWAGPVADIAPEAALPSGLTILDQAMMRPHPGAFPWVDAGRPMERPADAFRPHPVPLGRTWENLQPVAGRRPPSLFP